MTNLTNRLELQAGGAEFRTCGSAVATDAPDGMESFNYLLTNGHQTCAGNGALWRCWLCSSDIKLLAGFKAESKFRKPIDLRFGVHR